MKSLLIVTEQFTLGGLETHIRGEIEHLNKAGVAVHLAVGKAFQDALLPAGLISMTYGLSLGPECSPKALLVAIDRLRQIIREHAIECVHVHPFTSIIPAVVAAELEGVPYSITLHGPASMASYGPIYDLLLKEIVLPNAPLIIAVSPEVQNLLITHAPNESVLYIPNAVTFEKSFGATLAADTVDKRWLVVSRLDEFKIQGIADFCIKAKVCVIPGVLVVGDGPAKQQLFNMLEAQGAADYVELIGASAEVPSLLPKFSGVAGMGRVVLEGISARKPVVLVGYDGVKGVIDKQLLASTVKRNFSGRDLLTIDSNEFFAQLRGKTGQGEISEVFEFAKTHFNAREAWTRFLSKMSSLSAHVPSALTGLYHSLSANAIDGTTPYLDSTVILDRIEAVVCSKNYYDPRLLTAVSFCRKRQESDDVNLAVTERDRQIVCLNQVVAERDGQIASLNQAVAERDGQIESFSQMLAERDGEMSRLIKEIRKIKQSISWRLTSPLRVAKNLVVSPKRTSYAVIRTLFWKLPARLRQALHSLRQYVRGLPTIQLHRPANPDHLDLSWLDFEERVLKKRGGYKGVFIQELVIDWNVPLYQRPQHIAAALGRLGYLVIYRTDNWAGDSVNGFREVSANVWITNRVEVEEINNVVRSLYSTAYANTPDLLMRNGRRGCVVYEYIDHIDPKISGGGENIRRLMDLKKFAFEGGADFVVASAKKLYDEAASVIGKERVILVPNGVDTRHYRNPSHLNTPVPQSIIQFKKNHKAIVGYFGALAPWLWYEVIDDLARMRPDLGFVFIGPDYYGGAGNLPKCSNVLHMGSVDYKILPAYASHFDVCFIPFQPGEIAKTTSPLKLFEYFALEKPVVVTSDMDECTAYDEVFSGGTAEDLSHAFDLALQVKDSESFKSRLSMLADQNDWIERAKAMEICFESLKYE